MNSIIGTVVHSNFVHRHNDHFGRKGRNSLEFSATICIARLSVYLSARMYAVFDAWRNDCQRLLLMYVSLTKILPSATNGGVELHDRSGRERQKKVEKNVICQTYWYIHNCTRLHIPRIVSVNKNQWCCMKRIPSLAPFLHSGPQYVPRLDTFISCVCRHSNLPSTKQNSNNSWDPVSYRSRA